MNNEESPGSAPSASSSSAAPPASTTPSADDAIAADFAAHVEPGTRVYANGAPIITWKEGELPRIVDEAEAALLTTHADPIFQRGPMLVRVVRNKSLSMRHFKRPDAGSLGIVPVDKAYLVESLTRAAHWEKYDARSEKMKQVNAPELVAQTYLARSGHWKLRRLLATISAPTLRPDGSVLQEPGYDEKTCAWYDPCGVTFPKIPERPTKSHAMKAIDALVQVLDTVPFVEPADTSVALSLMLTALVRRSLPSAPLGAISATSPGSGKTLVADCISILATGVRSPAMSYPSTDEEAEKVALTILMSGDPVVLIDNVERPLAGAWLCSILTSETYQGRMLGANQMISVPTTTLFLATGNKLVIQGDLRTRTLLCRIDPKVERPEEREFAEDLKDVFVRKRAELVAAGLTLMRAYLHGGERSSLFRPWGRFEAWSRFCREPLMWQGLSDPCDSYSLIAEDDPDRQEHLAMMRAWQETFGSEAQTARAAINQAVSAANTALREVLEEVATVRGSGLSAKRLGKWLQRHEGRIGAGLKFVREGAHQGTVLWKVVAA